MQLINKQFTLIELIVVITVISILVAIVMLNITNLKDKAKEAALAADVKNIELAVELYKKDHNDSLPTVDNKQPSEGETAEIDFDKLEDYLKGDTQFEETHTFIVDEYGRITPIGEDDENGGELPNWNEDEKEEILGEIMEDAHFFSLFEELLGEEEPTYVTPEMKTDSSTGLLYVVHPKHVVIVGYIGSNRNVVIPSKIEGKWVSGISYFGLANFEGTNIQKVKEMTVQMFGGELPLELLRGRIGSTTTLDSVKMPKSMLYIGEFAFTEQNLTEVKLPYNLLHIGSYAFTNNYIEEVELPKFVQIISYFAFAGQGKLFKPEYAFQEPYVFDYDTGQGTEVDEYYQGVKHLSTLKKVTLNENLYTALNGVFMVNNIKEITIPKSKVEDGSFVMTAFAYGTIERVTIEKGATGLGFGAFYFNPVKFAEIPEDYDTNHTTFVGFHPDLVTNIINNGRNSTESLLYEYYYHNDAYNYCITQGPCDRP